MLWNIFSHIYDKDSFFPMIVHFEGARDAVQKKKIMLDFCENIE